MRLSSTPVFKQSAPPPHFGQLRIWVKEDPSNPNQVVVSDSLAPMMMITRPRQADSYQPQQGPDGAVILEIEPSPGSEGGPVPITLGHSAAAERLSDSLELAYHQGYIPKYNVTHDVTLSPTQRQDVMKALQDVSKHLANPAHAWRVYAPLFESAKEYLMNQLKGPVQASFTTSSNENTQSHWSLF